MSEITWVEEPFGNHWHAYAGPIHMEVWLQNSYRDGQRVQTYGIGVAGTVLDDEVTLQTAQQAALREADVELDRIIEQCQDAKYEIARLLA